MNCTIVIPSYNRPDLLIRAVRSALQACPENGEVLVVDDHSLVPAAAVLKPLQDARLRIHRTGRSGGAAAARNAGVAKALGEVVFFLDDDDELLSTYCRRVLQCGALNAPFGFCSTVERHGEDSTVHQQRHKHRLRSGPVPRSSPLRDHIAALSEGFWIRRQLFLDLGGFCVEQVVDEDTDLCCQLYRTGCCAWYEAEPGTVVYKGYAVAGDNAAQLTLATTREVQLGAYQRTYERNAADMPAMSEARWFLCARYLRQAAKAGRSDLAQTFLQSLQPWPLRVAARLYWWSKRGLRRLQAST